MDAAEQVAIFAACIYAPDDWVEVRRLPSAKSTFHRASQLSEYTAELTEANGRGEHIYAGANPRKDVGRKDADGVALARCLFVDFDDADLGGAHHRRTEAGLPDPTLAIFTGRGVHFYWRLDEPLTDLGLWSRHQRALIAALKSDDRIHDPPRIMRLPGFRNHTRERDAYLC